MGRTLRPWARPGLRTARYGAAHPPYRAGVELIEVVSPLLGARCTLVVADDGSCVVVDAGGLVADTVTSAVQQRGLRPQAVLATHGHADHTWDAGRLAARLRVPVVLHAADAYRLDDPWGTLGGLGRVVGDADGPLAAELRRLGADPADWSPPAELVLLGRDTADDGVLELGGVTLHVRHAPGHTEGSVLYVLDAEGDRPVALTGDVLFAGTVGRTDLPGGDPAAMRRTLREVVSTLPPQTVLLPGHGPATDLATELDRNPYLR